MSTDIKTKTLENAKKYYQKGWFYSSVAEYAELYHYNIHNGRKDNVYIQVKRLFNSNQIASILNESDEELDKIIRVLTYGSTWDEDEWLLVFTARIKLQLLKEYLSYSLVENNLSFDVFDALCNSINKKRNEVSINIAQKLIRKNWKILDRYWLDQIFSKCLSTNEC